MRLVYILLLASSILFGNQTYMEALSYYYDKNSSNDVKAIFFLKEAAEDGNADAAFLLGVAYEQGSVAPKSSKRSLVWYEKAALLGDVDAIMITGWRYYKGDGCDKNVTKAREWFLQAEALGDKEALELLILLEEESLF